ncbi:MAG TPA: LytTR family DNA-binding domain-containing protein [Chitinophagales bacterium]|nr:LytTR family DNA-binding domain-containing protein [Chitinophagales bacterium]
MERNDIITAIIADDESLARNVIKKYLADFPQVEIICECATGLEALNKINEHHPDVIFLDIQMPDLDGLSLLNELKYPPLVIFTTAFNQYAIKAFEMSATDYLLKPFHKERFAQAMNKVLHQRNSPDELGKRLMSLQQSLNEMTRAEKKFQTRVVVKEKESFLFLTTEEIMWLEASGDYVKIHTREKSFLKNISLNELEAKLNPQIFVRIHRSTIVNISFIKEMKPYFNGEYHIYLRNGTELKLSRSHKEQLSQIIGAG